MSCTLGWFLLCISFILPISALNDEGLSLLSWLSTFNSSSSSSFFHSWNPSDQRPCNWDFIRCSNDGFVSEIRIESINLATPFPTQIISFRYLNTLIISKTNLTGKIPPSISNLSSSLTTLNLSYNSLTGTVPPDIGKLSQLSLLALNSNALEGEIPREIGNCSKLQQFELVDNFLTGKVPKELGLLSSLQTFRAGGNSGIYGEIPREISNCKELTFLGLADTSISGELPASIGELSKLQTISIYIANLSGKIPPQIGNCSSLENLFLYENQLWGEIPAQLGQLKNLKRVLLWKNNLVGNIPETIGNCTELTVVDLSFNSLTGGIPAQFSDLVMLELFLLSSNNISGVIPSFIGNFSRMKQLELDNNQLTGEIPIEIGELKELTQFFAWQNQLHGSIPSELGNCAKLHALDLSHNFLTGSLPSSLFNLKNLTQLLLISNGLSGNIPPEIGNCTGLIRLRLGVNRFTGGIPPEIGSITSLSFLELSQNLLVGDIPPEIGNCSQLEMLDLHQNELRGTIPSSLEFLLGLNVLDLSMNRISGSVPESLGKLTSLNKLNLSGNYLSGSIPESLGLCKDLELLDMSSNRISGLIPNAIGRLQGLEISLNLSWNYLSGPIPEGFSSVSKLASLDISHNMLTGSLSILGELENLVSLDVSHNNFSGYLPDTTFFHELPLPALTGNPELCTSGNQCFVQFKTARISSKLHRKNLARYVIMCILFFIASGVLLTVMGILLINHAQRRALRRVKEEENCGEWEMTPYQKINFSVDDVVKKLSEANIIGQGCSGVVYRVEIGHGQVIAVKKLWPVNKGEELLERDSFSAEVNTLGCIRHKNIVRLLGCCRNRHTKLLMFDYIVNGSLFELLHEKREFLDWESRYKIIIGAAQGLAYLHHDCIPPIVHRDVKANNILVGLQFEAYLADFGLAKLVDSSDDTRSGNTVAGSYGYIAPEYGYSMNITEKSDVYSYGVVLLEVLTGMPPIDRRIPEGTHIVNWVQKELQRRGSRATDVLDERLRDWPESELQEMVQVLGVALLCVHYNPEERPTMNDVVAMLLEIKHETEESQADLLGKGCKTDPKEAHCSSFSRPSEPLIGASSLLYSCSSTSRVVFE
ncbi:LRR receptor-like serine/threonine-protein kinase RGI1 [Aristolochia californica]|uniref:LRR receptor-like serine/threonine-protein kinase RGI1 n=1 Tax=Aristolochia californica TaxID=171875 RepID=UPI0035D79C63